MNEEFQNLIDQYISGEMTNEETLEFEKELDSNVELKEQFVFTKTAQKTLKIHDFDKKLDFIKGLEESEEKVVPVVNFKRRIYWIAGLAASVLLVSFLFWQINQPSEIDLLYEEYFIPDDQPYSVRGPSEGDLIQECYKFYDQQLWNKSSECLENLVKTNFDPNHLYFLGISYLGMRKVEDAEKTMFTFDSLSVQKNKLSSYQDFIQKIHFIQKSN